MLPSSCSRTLCSSSSWPLRRTISSADMIIPGVQKPHCRPWCSRNACCIGCSLPSAARPSMVVTLEPSHDRASTAQDFTPLPSRCTVQHPHWLVSQPTCVPVSPRCSRSSCTSRVRPSTSALTGLPLTVSDTVATFCLLALLGLDVSRFHHARPGSDIARDDAREFGGRRTDRLGIVG